MLGSVEAAERNWGLLFQYLSEDVEEGNYKEAHHIQQVAEVFSVPRFTARAMVHGLRPARAFDIELGDDLLLEGCRRDTLSYLQKVRPGLVVVSPPCTM